MTFLPGVPQYKKQQIIEALRRPEGTFVFTGKYEGLFDKEKGRGLLLDVVSGKTVLRLEREKNLDVNFVYSSPGTGTRVATVNIEQLKDSIALQFFLVWSPEKISLHIGSIGKTRMLIGNEGRKASYQLFVGSDGSVVQVGDKGVDVMGVFVARGGKTVVSSPAINTWHDTIKAISILQTGTSKEGFAFESVVSCMSLVMLCTGLETYCKKRFIELIEEGIKPDYSILEKSFFTAKERKKGLINDLSEIAKLKNHSLAQEIAEHRRIDFGNYGKCRDAFKAYGIKLVEDLGVTNQTIQKLQKFILYRHKIVHVSPLIGVLNLHEVPPKEPIFANKKTVQTAIEVFANFVEGLHKATLALRP